MIMKTIRCLSVLIALLFSVSCSQQHSERTAPPDWKQEFSSRLPLMGHRNWILVVDKAFPLQNAGGITTLDTDGNLLEVLDYTLKQIEEASHVKPVIYTDRKLEYLDRSLVPGIDAYRESLGRIIGDGDFRSLLHDSVFVQIDEASRLFNVLVLKTNETIPYSSVFLELDCAYWSPGKEALLRESMKK